MGAAQRTYAVAPNHFRTISREDWREGARLAVLAALDAYVREALNDERPVGATDADLPALFATIDAQADRVAERINDPDSTIPGSAFLNIAPEAE